jgi:glycosyltransferase involved in cell wall biosynthesis
MKARPIAVVVPCFNEERRLDLQQFRNFAFGHPDVRFLFVDDGSTDSTPSILAVEARAHPQFVEVLRLEENVGKGEAVRLGLLEVLKSESRLVAFWDADLATPLDELSSMVECLEENPEISCVIGARVRLMGRAIERRAFRHYVGRFFASASSLVLGLPVYDTQCGAKVFRVTESLQSVLDRPFRSRWIFDVELLARLKDVFGEEVEDRLIEYPLRSWRDIGDSKLKPRDYFRSALHLFDLWLRRGGRRSSGAEGVSNGE